MSDPPVLRVRDLRKQFGAVTAVDGISFDVAPGEIFGLLGPNGAGKTTTLHMLLGLIKPTSGSIEVFGMDLGRHRQRVLKDVNFSASYVSLPARLTVRENLRVFAGLYGVPQARTRIDEVLELFGASQWADRPARQLSSGQGTLVHLAKAVLNRPRLLLLDEPTASLDPDVAGRTRDILTRVVRAEGTTLVITSHNMVEVERICTRIGFVFGGRMVADGEPGEVVRRVGTRDLETAFVRLAREGG
ncbi:MAG TPA: ABC transporter ATP-binding protein [Actinomycetota bacterium]|nr:ABC transporter ATP-binding protein [Actinomycetota bacterium]